MKSIIEHWHLYTNWLKQNLPEYYNLLNPPASENELSLLQDYFPVDLPENLLKLFSINNGNRLTGGLGSFLGLKFLDVASLIHEFETLKVMSASDWGSSYPENHIKVQSFNTLWIPIFGDFAGNFIGIDLDPDEKGTVGQIINFGRDEDDKFVIASNLNEFLAFIVSKIEDGTLNKSIAEEDEAVFSYGLHPQSHPIGDLREIFGPKR